MGKFLGAAKWIGQQFYHHIYYPVWWFYRRIRKCWIYGRHIWTIDQDYDHSYMLKLWKLKFEFMRELYVSRHAHLASAENNAKQIGICIALLSRLIANEEDFPSPYVKKQYEDHDKKWGELNARYGKFDIKGNCRSTFYRRYVITDKDKEKERIERINMDKHEEYMFDQDLDYLFHIIKRHLQHWWD